MWIFLLYVIFTFGASTASRNASNLCQKKYFEVQIYEDADFLHDMMYALSIGRCGVFKLQVCPSDISFVRPESEYYDSDYKRWNVSNIKNSTSREMLEYKIRRSSNEKWTKKENSSVQLPAEILALFDLFHAVSQHYEI